MPAHPRPQTPEGFPLWWHSASGRFCKKHKGRFIYFGADPAESLDEWQEMQARERLGLAIDGTSDATVGLVANHFFATKLRGNEVSPQTVNQYRRIMEDLIAGLGRSTKVNDLIPEDFARLRERFKREHSNWQLTKWISTVRSAFKLAELDEVIERAPRYGAQFSVPTAKAIRRYRSMRDQACPQTFSADEVRTLLAAASPTMRAAILCGINLGFGQTDIACLTDRSIDWESGWINHPRPKTGEDRRVPAWPETITALRTVLSIRPQARHPENRNLLFLTAEGNPVLRWIPNSDKPGKGNHVDRISTMFGKLVRRLKLSSGRGFYCLRRTAATVADELGDRPAVAALLGHIDSSMTGRYVKRLSDERVLAVARHVRAWLFDLKTIADQRLA